MPPDMTIADFEREAEQQALAAFEAALREGAEAESGHSDEIDIAGIVRPLVLRLLAAERRRVIDALPGGEICDPQLIVDIIRNMGDPP